MTSLDEVGRAELEAALEDPSVLKRLRDTARAHVHRGGWLDDEDLVQEAVLATLEGRRVWNSECVDAAGHLAGVIRSKADHEHQHAEKFQPVWFDEDVFGYREDPHHLALRRRAATTIAALRQLAADDRHVLQLLDAFEQDAFERSEILALTKLTHRQYEAARNRLARASSALPAALQSELSALRGAPEESTRPDFNNVLADACGGHSLSRR